MSEILPLPDFLKAKPSANTRQVGGDHYAKKAIQPWDAMECWMSRDEFTGFLRGNIIKYIARAGSKEDAILDIKKALHYTQKLIEVMENKNAKTD